MLPTLVSAIAVISTVAPSVAEDSPTAMDVREWVRQAAFDPATYFPSPYITDHSTVRIAVSARYGWHSYSIAIAPNCVDGETIPTHDCLGNLRARMVRAPKPVPSETYDVYSSELINRMADTRIQVLQDVKHVLRGVELEWVEADLRTCPGAVDALAQSADADWVPSPVSNPTAENGFPAIVLHPDDIMVEIQQYARLTSYRGWSAEGSPAAWAREMASVLESCWRPATVAAPWSR